MSSVRQKLILIDEWEILLVAGYVHRWTREIGQQPEEEYFCFPQEITDLCTLYIDTHELVFKVGDRVRLEMGKTGVVRYVGKPDFSDDVLFGIELDTWSPNAGDGSLHGEQIFKSSVGRAFFVQRRSVIYVMYRCKIGEGSAGSYARLKGIVRAPKFNGKTVKIVSYVEKKDRWKVKLLHAKQEKKYLGVRADKLVLLLDWELLNNPKFTEKESLKEYPKVGDQVKTRDGLIGIVKYVGNVEFAIDIGNVEHVGKHIGLSLHQWNLNGHDGTVKEKRYFETKPGTGYFVKLEDLTENMGPR